MGGATCSPKRHWKSNPRYPRCSSGEAPRGHNRIESTEGYKRTGSCVFRHRNRMRVASSRCCPPKQPTPCLSRTRSNAVVDSCLIRSNRAFGAFMDTCEAIMDASHLFMSSERRSTQAFQQARIDGPAEADSTHSMLLLFGLELVRLVEG